MNEWVNSYENTLLNKSTISTTTTSNNYATCLRTWLLLKITTGKIYDVFWCIWDILIRGTSTSTSFSVIEHHIVAATVAGHSFPGHSSRNSGISALYVHFGTDWTISWKGFRTFLLKLATGKIDVVFWCIYACLPIPLSLQLKMLVHGGLP